MSGIVWTWMLGMNAFKIVPVVGVVWVFMYFPLVYVSFHAYHVSILQLLSSLQQNAMRNFKMKKDNQQLMICWLTRIQVYQLVDRKSCIPSNQYS